MLLLLLLLLLKGLLLLLQHLLLHKLKATISDCFFSSPSPSSSRLLSISSARCLPCSSLLFSISSLFVSCSNSILLSRNARVSRPLFHCLFGVVLVPHSPRCLKCYIKKKGKRKCQVSSVNRVRYSRVCMMWCGYCIHLGI